MRKTLAVAALAAAALTASAASATTYTGAYSVTANTGPSGLDIDTSHDLSDPYTFSLSGNASTGAQDLFDIWTDESNINGSDTTSKPITVLFHFTAPGNVSGDVNGDTVGVNGVVNDGTVTWDGPLVLNFGATTLSITLSNETFNAESDSWYCNDCTAQGWDGGSTYGADVTATFVQTVTGGVPEPTSWALMISGFGMAGAMLRRRRTAVATAA